jgi:hypothetical protein
VVLVCLTHTAHHFVDSARRIDSGAVYLGLGFVSFVMDHFHDTGGRVGNDAAAGRAAVSFAQFAKSFDRRSCAYLSDPWGRVDGNRFFTIGLKRYIQKRRASRN